MRSSPVHASALSFAAVLALTLSGCPGSCGKGGGDAGTDATTTTPQCIDGMDNDGDALVDFPNDPGCVDGADDDETEPPECSDGRDNDGDAFIDMDDFGCIDANDDSELNPECSDGVDNDGDGQIDFPQDPDCVGFTDERETEDPDCSDLLDNDGDLATDFPDDPGCVDADDPSESDIADCGGLLPVVDIRSTGLLSGTWDPMDMSYFTGSCGGPGPEAIGYIDIPVSLALLSVNAYGTTDATTLYVRTTCDETATEEICGDFDIAAGESPVVELTGTIAPGPYYFFIDGGASPSSGPFFLHVFGIIQAGQPCVAGDEVLRCDSATGQICSEPIVGSGMFVCNAGQCSDGIDNDLDGVTDWPFEPGCTDPSDNTETDPVPPPQCANMTDDDGDSFTDYPVDPGCTAAGDDLEIDDCIPGVPLNALASDGTGAGTLSGGTSNFEGTCTTSFVPSGPEEVWAFDLPYDADVRVTTRLPGTFVDTAIYVRSTCDNFSTELGCNDNDPAPPFTSASTLNLPGLAAGTYYVFVDTLIPGTTGSYELAVTAVFASGAPCDPTSVNFTCNALLGDACQPDGMGGFACLPAACANGVDDDGDAFTDFPTEPGCTALADADETDPATPPVCWDGADNDGDALTDYGADPGCFFAADPTEDDNCIPGVPFTDLPADGHYFGSITSFTGSFDGSCSFGFTASAGEAVFILPVPAAAVVTATTVLPGTFFDTALYLRSTCDDAATELACNDNRPGPIFTSSSEIALTLGTGTYFLFVDGMNGATGSFELQVSGVFASGAPCDPTSLMFSCDASIGESCQDPGTGVFSCLPAQCSNGADDDGDAFTDFPSEPGCLNLADDDETDPLVAPVCWDGADNDGDALVDYGADPGCFYAADPTEDDNCIPGVPFVDLPVDGHYFGSVTSFTGSFDGTCTLGFTASAGENIFILSVPAAATVTATTALPGTIMDTGMYLRSTCDDAATELACNDNRVGPVFTSGSEFTLPLGAGTYFLFVDGMNGSTGSYELQVSGLIASGAACDPASLIFTCDGSIGDACQDPGTGLFACLPSQCANGLDDDGDAVADFPDEPGCLTLADDDETDPATAPICSDGADNDGDAVVDYPLDPGCFFAADATEEDECIPGFPFTDLPIDGHYFGSITSFTGSFDGTCSLGFSPSAGENVFIISVPETASVTFTTNLAGTFMDTALYLRSTCDDASTELGCNDNAPGSFSGSTIGPLLLGTGTYFLFVDGVNGATGSYELRVSGLIAAGGTCDPADLVYTCDAIAGYACTDPGGGFVCSPADCTDGADNDGDGDVDYPFDAGCTGPADTDETDPCPGAGCPQCSNGSDDDGDALIDYPADTSCSSASDDDESCSLFGTDSYGYTGCEEMMTATTTPCPDISTTGTLVPSAGSCDDCSGSIPVGFSFDFYGTAYTTVNVISNGKLFTSDASYSNSCLPGGLGATAFVYWDDWYTSGQTGGGAFYALTGTAPNRVLEIQWKSPPCCTTGGAFMDVRALLHETTNEITTCYVDTTWGIGTDNGAGATLGIQNGAGSTLEYECNSGVVTPGLVLHYLHP